MTQLDMFASVAADLGTNVIDTKRRAIVREMIAANGGKFMTLVFLTKNGKVRTLNGRVGVKKGTKGGKSPIANAPEYVTVFDVAAGGFRSVSMDNVLEMRTMGNIVNFAVNPDSKYVNRVMKK